MIKTNFINFLFHVSKIKNYIFQFNIILISIFFLINSTSPFVYFFDIHKIGSFSNIADNWMNYFVMCLISLNSLTLILVNKKIKIPYFIFPVLFYMLSVFVATVYGEEFNKHVIWEILSFLTFTLIFIYMFQNNFDKKKLEIIFYIIIFSGFVNSLISYCQIHSIQILNISFGINSDPTGGFHQKNKLASFLSTTLLFTLLLKKKTNLEISIYDNIFIKHIKINFNFYLKFILILISIFKIYIIKSTNSLTGLLGFGFGLLLITILRYLKRKKTSNILIPIVPFIVLTIITLFHEEIRFNLTKNVLASTKIINKINSSSFTIRKDLYIACIEIFLDKPFIGHGLGTFKEVFQSKRAYVNNGKVPSTMIWIHPHNEFLYRLIESGLLGGIGLLTLTISFLAIVISLNKLDSFKYFSLISPLALHLQTETPFHHNEISFFLFIFILYLSMQRGFFAVIIPNNFDIKIKYLFSFILITMHVVVGIWLIEKTYLSSNASKAYHLINKQIPNHIIYQLLKYHLNDSYYKNLAQYILLLHHRKNWILSINNEQLLIKFIEESEKNHSWLPSKNLPLLKAIALAKLDKIEEANFHLKDNHLRFPNNPNFENANSIVEMFTKKYREKNNK